MSPWQVYKGCIDRMLMEITVSARACTARVVLSLTQTVNCYTKMPFFNVY